MRKKVGNTEENCIRFGLDTFLKRKIPNQKILQTHNIRTKGYEQNDEMVFCGGGDGGGVRMHKD